MADQDKPKPKRRRAPSPAKSERSAAGAAKAVPIQRRAAVDRPLTRVELETLRARLQKKFH
jgi:hypothetical protein